MIHSTSTTLPSVDLLSPNQHGTSSNDDININTHQRQQQQQQQQQQQRKLDPRTCTQCGQVLFTEKSHLLHCQTHAANDKQCWICGVHDNEIKKHILTEHGNQKFTNAGFKV
jgi:hypothetical protein